MIEPKNTSILGIKVSIIPLPDLIKFVTSSIQSRKKNIISNINIHAANLAYSNENFRSFLNHSDIVFCDGYGIKLATQLIRDVSLFRYTPPDWFDQLAITCVNNGFSLFFLGTQQKNIEKVADIFRKKYPGIKIVGTNHGFFDKSHESLENKDVIEEINTNVPDILLVGFGMPLQEKWISENFSDLNVKVIFPVGAYFDYASESIKRAPKWMTDHGLEWLGRLIIEPGRLWKRYLIGNPLFFWRIIKHHILRIPLPYTSSVYESNND